MTLNWKVKRGVDDDGDVYEYEASGVRVAVMDSPYETSWTVTLISPFHILELKNAASVDEAKAKAEAYFLALVRTE